MHWPGFSWLTRRGAKWPWTSILILGVVFFWSACLWPPRKELAMQTLNIGPSDPSGYALQARSLHRGQGLNIPYITNFFHRYDPEIHRLDDHWPPLLSMVIAGAYRLHGESLQTAALTTAAIGCFALPLAAAWLAMCATRIAWTGLIASLPFLLSESILMGSLQVLSDQLLAVVVTLFLGTLLASRRHSAWLLASGFLIGLAWYGKGSQVILFPMLGAGVLVIHGPKALIGRAFLGAVLIAIALMTPRLWYNTRQYGHPLHSTQSYVSSYFGLTRKTWTNWDMGFYSVYWDHTPPPGLRDRFLHKEPQQRNLNRNLERTVRMLTLGAQSKPKDWEELGNLPNTLSRRWLGKEPEPDPDARNWEPVYHWPEPALSPLRLTGLLWAGFCVLVLPVLLLIHVGWLPGQEKLPWLASGKASPLRLRAQMEDAALLGGFLLSQGLFLGLFWISLSRLLIPLLPAGMALSLMLPGLLYHLTKRLLSTRLHIPGRIRRLRHCITPVVCVLASWLFLHHRPAIMDTLHGQEARASKRKQKESGFISLRGVIPDDAVLMSRHPWSLLLHLDGNQRAVGFPYADPDVTLAIARYYRVEYLLPSGSRKPMSRFLKQHPDYVDVVHASPLVYRLRYDRIPPEAYANLETVTPKWDPRRDPMPR